MKWSIDWGKIEMWRSPEWQFIPDDDKEEVGLTFDHDGEFWMSFRDFGSHFSRLEIVNLNPDSLEEDETDSKKWVSSNFEGSWVRGSSAGGCRNHLGMLLFSFFLFLKYLLENLFEYSRIFKLKLLSTFIVYKEQNRWMRSLFEFMCQ